MSSLFSTTISSSIDPKNLKYYHGQIDRVDAEHLLEKNGQFLLRTSASNVKQLVLSCMHNGQSLHFIIHETSTEFMEKKFFFENESFNSINELIDHYVKNQIPVTSTSPAIIIDPVNKSQKLDPNKNQEFHNQFPTEYLYQLYCKISAIKLEESINSVEDVPREDTICDIILQQDSDLLAQNLFQSNLQFIGLDHHFDEQNNFFINSGLELMLLPEGTQLRKDLIVRHECLKYFVIITILNKLDCGEHFEMIKKWIEIADKLENVFSDHYGFGSIMCGLCFPKINNSNIWKEFDRLYVNESRVFANHLSLKFYSYLNAKKCLSTNSSLPFFIQLCHTVECSYIIDSIMLPSMFHRNLDESIRLEKEYDEKIGLNNFSFDDIIQLTNMRNQIIDNLKNFAFNSKLAQNGFLVQSSSSSSPISSKWINLLFQTNFHIKFLFQKTDSNISYDNFYQLEQKLNEIFFRSFNERNNFI